MERWRRRLAALFCAVTLALTAEHHSSAQGGGREPQPADDPRFSAMGRLAHMSVGGRLSAHIARLRAARLGLTADDDDGAGPAGGQGETSIAVDATGQHIVIGINDTRGFTSNPLSVSGFMYSDDGGATFTDGGQLPVTTGTSQIGTTSYPQVFGDPEVKYLGGSTFVYFSIMVKKFSSTGTAQTMCVHRSTDYGHTWQGPYEIPAATNPHGLTSSGNAFDAADKEFAGVDPDSGRVMMTWSNFTSTTFAAGGVEISSTFSDNLATAAPPTWSTRKVIANSATDGQASIPRFAAHGSTNVYVAWRRFATTGANQNVGFARSTDNGVTFSAPLNTTADFFTMDQVLGNDRNNTSPSLAVDTTLGAFQNYVYLVYSNNDNRDGADVVFQRSTDQGLTFSAPVTINSRPGSDRAQWFPWVTVDSSSGRVYVFYYDQGVAADGDLTEVTYQYSDDGGSTWSRPAPLSARPFHAGYGNDTGEPNLGDYNQAVAQNGELFAVWAGNPPLIGFADGEPASLSMTAPDATFARVASSSTRVALRLGAIAFADAGPAPLGGNGAIDPGEQVALTIPLTNYVLNGAAAPITGISGTLTSATPGVTVVHGTSAYPDLAAGATGANTTAYVIAIGSGFVPATHIDLTLSVSSGQGSTALPFMEPTGTAVATTLLSENFDGVAPGTLPAGWTAAHGGGNNTVNWTTRNQSLGASPATISNAAYHVNANDGAIVQGTRDNTRWERLFSPSFTVPANADYVTVDFDVAYDTEDEPLFNIQTYDGVLLRIADQTPGRQSRSVAVEAFAETFTTGAANFYPKHLIRSSNAAYFPDLSAWGGDSSGYRHVHLKLPGMAGSTAQLRFEFTQDNIGTCADVRPGHACGVLVDNVVVGSVRSVSPTSLALSAAPNPAAPAQPVTTTATITTGAGAFATDGSVTFREGASVLAGPVAVSSGHAAFTTSSLAAGPHWITAAYASASGLFTSSSGSAAVVVGGTTTMSVSSGGVVFGKQLAGTVSAAQSVHVTNTGGTALLFAAFDGSAPAATFAAGTDFQGQTTCPLSAPGLAPGAGCDFLFAFAPTAAGSLGHTFAIVFNGALPATQTIALSGTAFVVDEPTVLQSLLAGGGRLRALQNPDGGWFFGATWTDCFAGPGVSCPNTLGVTGLALPFAYSRTGDPSLLQVMTRAGDALVAQYTAALPQPPLPFSQDIEFLVALGSITGNPAYTTTAQSWFQVVINQYPNAADKIDADLAGRDAEQLRSLAAWDAASLIRAAVAVGQAGYAQALATRIVARQADWADTDPANPSADNPFSYDYTILGEGSLLWAFHDLPGFDAQISSYRSFLLSVQDPAGSWDGDTQITAYVLSGLAAVGGADQAMTSAAALFIASQLPEGGWADPAGSTETDEFVEIDAEIVRAMSTLFNTPGGAAVQVAPAQLATVTFSQVDAPGRTAIVAARPASAAPVPPEYTILNDLTYTMTTTAAASGPVRVCFDVPWVADAAAFAPVRVLHEEGDALVDRTILAGPFAPDAAARRVCAVAPDASSPRFAIALLAADATPPSLSVALSPSAIWPPDGRFVTVTATIDVHDDLDPSPIVTLVSVEAVEPGRARGRAGNADVAGAVPGTDDRSFQLRAEAGAVYRIVYRAADHAGNARDVATLLPVKRP